MIEEEYIPKKVTDAQRKGQTLLIYAVGRWWTAEWFTRGDYGPGWYPGVSDGTGGNLGFPDAEVLWWLPVPLLRS